MREKNKLLDETTWRIIREAKGIAGWVAVSAVLGSAAVLCSIAAPEILGNLIQKLYDFGLSDRQTPIRDSLVSGLLLLTAVYAAQGVFRYLNMQLMNQTVSRHFTCDLRIAISDKIQRLPVKYVDQTPVGDVLNRMIDDVSAMGNYIHQVFDVMVEGVFQITMIAVAMFLKNWVLACLVIVLTPISLWISSKIAGASGKYYDEWFKKSGELTEIVEESFTNFATAKAYNLEEYTAQKHDVVNEQLRKAVSKANFTGSIVQPLIKFANAMAYICINLIGGWLIVRRGEGTVEGDKIRLGEQGVQIDILRQHFPARTACAAVGEDVHAEGAGDVRHGLTDAPEADDAQRLSGQFHLRGVPEAEGAAATPSALVYQRVVMADPVAQLQHQRQRELGYCGGAVGGNVGHGNAPAGAGGTVHGIVARRLNADQTDAGTGIQQPLGDGELVHQHDLTIRNAGDGFVLGVRAVVNGQFAALAERLVAQLAGI